MTREKAANILDRRTTIPGDGYAWEQINEAIDMAISALTPPTQEQMERVWPGCPHCTQTNARQNLGYQYCEHCGRPLTPAAWEELRKRREALNENIE